MPGYHARMHNRIRFAAGCLVLAMAIALGLGTVASATVQARDQTAHAARDRHNPAGNISAGTIPAASIRITDAWVRAAPPGAMMLAGYMTLHNDGDGLVRLMSAESDAFGTVEAHRTLVEAGVSRMRPAGEVAIAAHQSLRFEPGGLHLMLMQPSHAVKSGDVLHFRLRFSDGRTRAVTFPVRAEAPSGQH